MWKKASMSVGSLLFFILGGFFISVKAYFLVEGTISLLGGEHNYSHFWWRFSFLSWWKLLFPFTVWQGSNIWQSLHCQRRGSSPSCLMKKLRTRGRLLVFSSSWQMYCCREKAGFFSLWGDFIVAGDSRLFLFLAQKIFSSQCLTETPFLMESVESFF